MTDAQGLNPRTPKELLDAGKQLALKSDVWSDMSIEQIVQKIKDIFGFDIPNWEQLTANFAELRQAIDGTYTGTNPALLAIQGTIGVLRRLAAGIIEPWRLPLIPLSHIGEASPNLLENGSFDGPNPIEETEGWTLDTSVGRTSPGSARTFGNGTRRVLLSNVVLCTPEQKFDIGGFVTWSMLTGGGTGAFKLSAVAYDDTESVVEEKVIAQIDSPSGAQAWTALLGQYTVPTGTTKIRVQVEVAATVTGGTINWDDLSVTKYGSLPQRMVAGLVSALGDLGAGIAAAVEAMGNFFDKLTGKVGTTIADLQSWAGQLKTILSGGTVGSGIFPTLDNGLKGAVDGVRNFAQQILDAIVKAIRGIPIVGAGIADLLSDVEGLRETADTANATAITADTKATTAVDTAVQTIKDGLNNQGPQAAPVQSALKSFIDSIFGSGTSSGSTPVVRWSQEVLLCAGPVVTGPNDIPLGFQSPFAAAITSINARTSQHASTGSGSKIVFQTLRNGTVIHTATWNGGNNSYTSGSINLTGINVGDVITFNVTEASSQMANMSITVGGRYT